MKTVQEIINEAIIELEKLSYKYKDNSKYVQQIERFISMLRIAEDAAFAKGV